MDLYKKFYFINENKYAYITAYEAIDELDLWEWIKKDHDSFTMPNCKICKSLYKNDNEYFKNVHKCNHEDFKNYKLLENKIADKYPYHSSASYIFIIRTMQKISKIGYYQFKWNYIHNKKIIYDIFVDKYGYYKVKYQEIKETNKKEYLKVLFLVFKINQVFSDPKYNYCKKRIKNEYIFLFLKNLYF